MANNTLYTKNGCPQCVFMKRLLDEKDIDYLIINIDAVTDSEKEEILKFLRDDLKATSFPVLYNSNTGQFISGFRPEGIDKIC